MEAVVCTLRPKTCEQFAMALTFGYDVPATFSITSDSPKCSVHISGYFQPGPEDNDDEESGEEYDFDEDEDDEDDEEMAQKYKKLAAEAKKGGKMIIEDVDDDDDDDDDDDEDDDEVEKGVDAAFIKVN